MMDGVKILVVDDDAVIRMLMRTTLETDGFVVVEAADGEIASRLCASETPDAIIADVVMPHMDGYELCRVLRQRPQSAHVPILMATGLEDMASIAKAYEVGANDFISKPLNWNILNHRVRYMLRAARASYRYPPPSTTESGAGQMRDATKPGMILIVDDDPIIRTLMRATLENDGFSVIEACDGEEAYRLCSVRVPDAIVADVIMPRMDGFELSRELRRRPGTAHVPILVATGLDDVPSITKAYEAGATDFISKPINWVILNHRVRYMLRSSRAFEDLRENQKHLVAAKEAAEAASNAKTQFLANMSHELRTPLNAIIGFSALMRDRVMGPLSDKYVEYARDINDSGTHLLAMINDILDLTRADANELKLREEVVALAPIVALSMNIVQQMATAARIAYSVNMDDNLPLLLADAGKLRQILINLLSNAVKFTPSGGRVTLHVEVERSGCIAFRVEDSGIGIPADKIAVALSPFGQVDSGLARKYDGAGLGLPLTKRLAELHGGTMEIESVPMQGTVVTVRFPQDRTRPAPLLRAVSG